MLSGAIPGEIRELLAEEIDPGEKIGDLFAHAPTKMAIHVLVNVRTSANVVVPPQEVAQFVSQDGIFKCCSDQFFSLFPTVDEANSWLEFPSPMSLTDRQKLYIRSSYRSIAAQALAKVDPNRWNLCTGTPGMGKSVFVYYAMWKLIKDKKRVLLMTEEPAIYFDGSTVWEYKQKPYPTNQEFWSPDLWCLVDSVDPTSIARFPILRCSTLLVSTLQRDCIRQFHKLAPTPKIFYMPLWTKEELTTIAPLYPMAEAVWQDRFQCLGGVPRLVLQIIQTDPQALLMSACSCCSLDDCINFVSLYSPINSKTKIIQTLIHILSQEPYRDSNVAYASELAVQVIARTKWQSDREKMQSLLGPCDGHPLIQSLCGYIFEPYAMDLLEKGGVFECRKLFSGAVMRQRDTNKRKRHTPDSEDERQIDIRASPLPRQIVDPVNVGQLAHQLYVPHTSHFAAIDAWIPDVGGFQMTVGKKYGIKDGAADDLSKLGPNGNRLYFLLPPLYYESFTKKTPQTIEQFAFLIPYPEEV